MPTQLMIAALRRGQTGSEILDILDALTDESGSETVSAEPTLDPIDF